MSTAKNISIYDELSTSQKFLFFEEGFISAISSVCEKDLNHFLREIIFDSSENTYIRKKALETFVECVIIKRLKVRHALCLLVDDWSFGTEMFLELQRLKELFFFYNEEQGEIERIFINSMSECEAEIISECCHNLGLINMQKSFLSVSRKESIDYLQKSKFFFGNASDIIENRIDSNIFAKSVSIILDIWGGIWGNVEEDLKHIASLLFRKDTNRLKHIIQGEA